MTGCSHPGIDRVMEDTKKIFPEKSQLLVAGGFLLRDHTADEVREISSKLEKLGLNNIGPSHCTGSTALKIFQREWKDDHIRLYFGDDYRF